MRRHEAAGFSYLEIVSGEADLEAPLPMVVAFHGRADRPQVPDGPYYGVARPMRLILPRAPTPLEDGYTWLPVSVTEGRTDELARSLAEMSDRLAVFLEEVRTRHRTVGEPIVTGFSQGGMLTFTLAVRHPGSVGAALPLAGFVPPSLIAAASSAGAPRIRAMHGSDDPIVPVEPTRKVVRMLAERGFWIELREMDGAGHAMSPAMHRLFSQWLAEAVEEAATPLGARRRAGLRGRRDPG